MKEDTLAIALTRKMLWSMQFCLFILSVCSLSQGQVAQQIGGPADRIYVAGSGLYATNPNTGHLWKYNSAPLRLSRQAWTDIGDAEYEFAADDSTIYAISKDQSSVWQYTGTGREWTTLFAPPGGKLDGIYAGGSGLYVRNTKGLWKYGHYKLLGKDAPGWLNWKRVGDWGYSFAVGANTIWACFTDVGGVYEYVSGGTFDGSYQVAGGSTPPIWKSIGLAAKAIYTDTGGYSVWAIERDTFAVRVYTGNAKVWNKVLNSLEQQTVNLAFTKYWLYGQSYGKNNLWRATNLGANNWQWKLVATDVIRTAAAGNIVYFTDSKGVWQLKDP